MSKEILSLVDVLAREKNLDLEVVFKSVEKALATATKKSFDGENPDIEVKIDRSSGKYKTIRKWRVVSDIDFYDDDTELSLSDVTEQYGFGEIGDVIEKEIANIDLGRVSAQTARTIITQGIKEAEREQVLNDYLTRNNGIVVGKIRKFERGNLIVDCGKIEAIIMKNDIIPREVLRPGDLVKGYLDKNQYIVKNGRLVISRVKNEFISKLFENNVPEVASGKVEIIAIAREPSIRAKVAVVSHDPRIDAKGACIGFRNQRIESVMRELSGEKIDIVEYSDDLAKYTLNALAPAEINSIIVDDEKLIMDVIVDDDKLGSAIGPDGVNVRLAGKLVGYNLNVLGVSDAENKKIDEKHHLVSMFNDELDVEDDISEILVANGFTSIEEVAYVDINELLEIEDFDQDIANELQSRAKNKLLSKTLLHKNEMDKLSLELNQVVKFSNDILLKLVGHNVFSISDFADLAADELADMINVDMATANKLILKAREVSGYFN